MANGTTAYNDPAATEDTATLGTDPSAVAGPYGTGDILRGAARCVSAGGPYAVDPERSEFSGLVARSQVADACIPTCRLQEAYETPAGGTLSGDEPLFCPNTGRF